MADEWIELEPDEEHRGMRLDVYLAEAIEDASRSFLQRAIREGCVKVDGLQCVRASRKVAPGDRVDVVLPPAPPTDLLPEPIPLEVLHEDAHVLVVNKPAGLVVHPAPGHPSGTLVNAVLHHCRDFAAPGDDPLRPGIVHRLDRDTSGVMVVAKTQLALTRLAEQAGAHAFDRRYLALARGDFTESAGRIDATVGRSLADRKRMAVTGVRGKEAVTHYEVRERFGVAALLALELETGRTHQIRVHLRFAGHPVLGDPVYGVRDFSSWAVPDSVRAALSALPGQALHAERLGFEHPASRERLTFSAPPPRAILDALEALRALVAEGA